MPSVLSNYAGNLALVELLSGARYLAAHTSDPTPLALLASEVAGGGYARQLIKFSPPAGRSAASINAQRFPGMPACIVTYLAVWDALSNGNLIYVIDLDDFDGPITVKENAALDAAPGDIAISV